MIFNLTDGYVPEVYSDSYDYKAILRLLSVLFTVLKFNTDNIWRLYSSEKCDEKLLPMLAKMVGYEKYDYNKDTESQRKIVGATPTLIRNKGSLLGLELATALSLSTLGVTDRLQVDMIDITVTYADKNGRPVGRITIAYPANAEIDYNIIDMVRPFGMELKFVPTNFRTINDKLTVNATNKTMEQRSIIPNTDEQSTTTKYEDLSVVEGNGSAYEDRKSYVNKARVLYKEPVQEDQEEGEE